jgi:hypothetical protein
MLDMIKDKIPDFVKEWAVPIAFFATLLLSVVLLLLAITEHAALERILRLPADEELDYSTITTIFGIIPAALSVALSSSIATVTERKSARQETYQRLEFESIALFRFEIDNTALARITWDDSEPYEKVNDDSNLHYQVLQHICQVLNLFEMAVRFKKDGIIHHDVFCSWIAWIYDLCSSEMFLHYWYLDGLKENYIAPFQKMIDDGLLIAHGETTVKAVKNQPQSDEEKAAREKDENKREEFNKYMNSARYLKVIQTATKT